MSKDLHFVRDDTGFLVGTCAVPYRHPEHSEEPSLAVAAYSAAIRAIFGEVLHLRHHLLRQQLERVAPGLRALDVVEAEHQELAEAADLVVDLLDLLDDGLRRADDPVVPGAVFRRHVGVRRALDRASGTRRSRTGRAGAGSIPASCGPCASRRRGASPPRRCRPRRPRAPCATRRDPPCGPTWRRPSRPIPSGSSHRPG